MFSRLTTAAMPTRNALRTFASATKFKSGSSKPNVAIAGATGAVGQEFLRILKERDFPMDNLKLLASSRSKGKKMNYGTNELTVEELTNDSFKDVDIALFSCGGSQSKQFAPAAVSDKCVVVDNSSAYRMTEGVPLVVPEVNPEAALQHNGIIANPNCSTIIMVVPMFPLHKAAGITRAVVSTYQAASGAGATAMEELEEQARQWARGESDYKKDIWGRQYIWNVFSHNSTIDPQSKYNEEEIKMIRETKKIFNDTNVLVDATCVRVPVLRTHCESINLTFKNKLTASEALELLSKAPGVKIVDDIENNQFAEPLNTSNQDDVIVSRVRQDLSQPEGKGITMFIAGDQIRKGAATNAVQIAELLL